MRILYVSGETPLLPAGGIATYLGYIVPAMQALGHETFLFTWTKEGDPPLQVAQSPFKADNTHVVKLPRSYKALPGGLGTPNHVLADLLLPALLRCLDEWRIEVVEATDFLAPALMLYQQVQTGARARGVLCATYHHGFVEDFFDADCLLPSLDKLRDLVGERQQCRVSDLVVAPSRAAAARLAARSLRLPQVEIVREPYRFDRAHPAAALRPAATYLGRVALSKGVDLIAYLCNVLNGLMPLERLRFIGREVATPFKQTDIREYLRRRLVPALRDRVEFHGFLPRESALALLEPGEFAPHLGYAETFSYACIESLDHGQIPLVRAGTPMAEFFPAGLQDCVLGEQLGHPGQIEPVLERVLARAPALHAELIEYNRRELDPERIAAAMGEVYERAWQRKHGRTGPQPAAAVRARAELGDVTLLMPIHRPGELFLETVDALAALEGGCPRVLICDDGTPEAERHWFDYAQLRLPDCRIFRQTNGGLLAARCALIERLESRLAIFLDADDILEPAYVVRVLEAYNEGTAAPQAVLTQRWNFDEGAERLLWNNLDDYAHLIFNDFRMTALIEAAVLRELTFDPARRNGEADDWDFWLRFAAAGHRAAMVPEPLFRYRFRSGTMSWPWSAGQGAGTNQMLFDSVARLIAARPEWGPHGARALSRLRMVAQAAANP